jgi:hypothetical protein
MTIQEKVNNINLLLKKSKLKIPSFRNEVTSSGKNVQWLLKNIHKENTKIPKNLIDLLNNFW